MIATLVFVTGLFSFLLFGVDVDMVMASNFTVDSAGDLSDWNAGDGICDDGAGNCTLRAAIEEANILVGADTIHFNIGGGPNTIQPSTALPHITETVTINGYSEPGAQEATTLTPATLMIELDGSNYEGGLQSGLTLVYGSDGSAIKGLVINRCDSIGIRISNSNHNTICGNYIGTDVTGTFDFGNTEFGIRVDNGSFENTIGGTTPAERNLISGNDIEGLNITDSNENLVRGNYVGTDATGTVALANTWGAIALMGGASYNTIGGKTPAERNIIAGGYTVVDPGSTGNVLQGNYIGTDVTGTVALGIIANGVCIQSNAFGNIIGGTFGTTPGGPCTGACNVISGNGGDGVHMQFDVSDNIVQGNFIGTDVTGTITLGNDLHGVSLFTHAFNNLIGGPNPGEGNIVSGNGMVGIDIDGPDATGNIIQGNFIGTDVTGTLDLGNGYHGVFVFSSGNTIGGTVAGTGNIISGNNSGGINMGGGDSTDNLVQGNYIGTDVTGSAALPNLESGITLGSCSNNTIGGSAAGQNRIHYNGNGGITLYSAVDNTISYNRIQHNMHNGLYLLGSSETTLTQNIISSNSGYGIICDDQSNMTITNNTIADNISGGILAGRYSSFAIINSILWDNGLNYEIELYDGDWSDSTISYSNVQGGWDSVYYEPESNPPDWGEGMTDMNPLFAYPDEDDYHLSWNSPCIDSGTDVGVYTDIDGDAIPQGDGIDMGVDEYTDVDDDGWASWEDCNDTDENINPGHPEVLNNGIDDDCDGNIDENCFIGIIMK